MRHFDDGDYVRIYRFYKYLCSGYRVCSVFLLFYFYFLMWIKGFSIGDWRILYKKGPFPWFCAALCLQCKDLVEVRRLLSQSFLNKLSTGQYI